MAFPEVAVVSSGAASVLSAGFYVVDKGQDLKRISFRTRAASNSNRQNVCTLLFIPIK